MTDDEKRGLLRRGAVAFMGLNPWAKAGSGLVALVLGGLAIFAAYTVVHRIFFGGADVKQAHASTVVADEQGKAAEHTGQVAIQHVIEREHFNTRTDVVVREAQNNVDRQTTFRAVHDAGIAGLHGGMHDGPGGPAEATQVQPVRGPYSVVQDR